MAFNLIKKLQLNHIIQYAYNISHYYKIILNKKVQLIDERNKNKN